MQNNSPRLLAPNLYHLVTTDIDADRMVHVVIQLSATTVPLLQKAIALKEPLALSRLGEWGEMIGYNYGRYPDESLRDTVRARFGVEV